jgi:NDP-sugar pyrophosphorylase family protein
MRRTPITEYGYNFIEGTQIPAGADEYYLRDQQISGLGYQWRHLSTAEIRMLEGQGNISPNWNDILVEEPFDFSLLRGNSFFGLVRIGSMEPFAVSYHDFALPEGIRDSHIISCDIGRHCAIHRCAYISHYIIGERCILSEIDEMDATNHAKFGNGIVTEGEDESVRISLSIMNEAEGRSVLPFDTMICADAWLWATYREEPEFLHRLQDMTNRKYDLKRGWYATVGNGSVIKACHVIKDVRFGEYSYVKGANKLKNLTLHSNELAPSQIGEGVELVNGIIGYGCHVFYGVKAVRFIMGNNSNLKYGARLLNSILGDNSTISCCEVLNTLVFPFHEQHHNNSFLIAALVMGQSNMAAGANIGSNHNTRGNDGELRARRGFWPALSSSIKYNSNFASFTLITKGDYPNELNIQIPFSMVSYNEHEGCLTVMPAYWWMYNRYALERNGWKFRTRDKRKVVVQHIESDYLAPDTMEEIEQAMDLMSLWVGRAALAEGLLTPADVRTDKGLAAQGRQMLENQVTQVAALNVTTRDFERSMHPTKILKVAEGYRAYQEMLMFACMRTLLQYLAGNPVFTRISALEQELLQDLAKNSGLQAAVHGPFMNMGGQIVSEAQIQSLMALVKDGKVSSWDQMHAVYDDWWKLYPQVKATCALQTLYRQLGCKKLDATIWEHALNRFSSLCDQNALEVLRSRKKDHDEPFRKSTYRNHEEMVAVLGLAEDNQFVKESRRQMDELKALGQRFSVWA